MGRKPDVTGFELMCPRWICRILSVYDWSVEIDLDSLWIRYN